MSNEMVNLTTKSQNYDPLPENKYNNTSYDNHTVSTPPPTNNLHIEKLVLDAFFRPPKSTIQKSVFNPNVWDAQYYNVVEYLTQEPCSMSTLEVLQTFHAQRNNL